MDLQSSGVDSIAAKGMAGLLAIGALIKTWRMLSAEKVNTAVDRAEGSIYANLLAQIERHNKEIEELKLETAHLREEIARAQQTYREAQEIAIEIYAEASITKRTCPQCAKILQLARRIYRYGGAMPKLGLISERKKEEEMPVA